MSVATLPELMTLLGRCQDEARLAGAPLSEPQLDALIRALYESVDAHAAAADEIAAIREVLAAHPVSRNAHARDRALSDVVWETLDALKDARAQVERQRDRLVLADATEPAAYAARLAVLLRRIVDAQAAGDLAEVRAGIAAARQALDTPAETVARAAADLARLDALRPLLRAVRAYVDTPGDYVSVDLWHALQEQYEAAAKAGLLEGLEA